MKRRDILKSSLLATTGLSILPNLSAFAGDRKKLINSAWVPCAEQMEPEFFKPGKPAVKARLLANENPYGPSEKALQALNSVLKESYMYPGRIMRDLVEMIAKEENLSPEHIMLGAGSTQLLQASFMEYAPKGSFVVADPGYISNEDELPLTKIPLSKDYQHDLEAMASAVNAKTSMVYVCNPNNPTGTILDAGQLNDFCASVSPKVPVMIDEAYIDLQENYQPLSMVDCVRKGQNVIIMRTFSKLHAFAGLRVGYCIAQPQTIEALKKYSTANSLSMPSVAAAKASYLDKEFPAMVRPKLKEAKDYIYTLLKELSYEFIPSSTNFVLFPLRMKGDKFIDLMSNEGVLVRRWEFNQQHWCRVSLGKMEDMKTFGQAFTKVVS